MVCKEDVLSWFKDLESYKRIDVMHELLNMCVPFEIRFLGTCVEEIGKHSYQELRGPAITANDVEKLSKDPVLAHGLLDDGARHRVLVYMSLLTVRNSACANWYYKTLFRTEWLEEFVAKGTATRCPGDNLLSELLLLLTMGLYHPAFTFEQKCFFGKLLQCLLEQREAARARVPSPKVQQQQPMQQATQVATYCHHHPPGFTYPPPPKMMTKQNHHQDIPAVIPGKTGLPLVHSDTTLHQQHPPPPGLPPTPVPQTPLEFITLWNRPGFTGTICGAPEVPPFPQPLISPLVSQTTSPTTSRSTSPHRSGVNVRLGPVLASPPAVVETTTTSTPQLPLEQISQSSLPPVYSIELKIPEEELNHVQEEKRDAVAVPPPLSPWLMPVMGAVEAAGAKPLNGLRFVAPAKPPPPPPPSFLLEQLSLEESDGGGSPPGTPPVVPAHGPGRGEAKSTRAAVVNGVQQEATAAAAGATTTTVAAQAGGFGSNCATVPYSAGFAAAPPPPYTAPIPARFHYTHHSSPFPHSSHFQAVAFPAAAALTDNHIYTTLPYVPLVYSSALPPPPHQQQRSPPNCYNCGAAGHSGPDCAGQTIEEITQKKAYTLEFAAAATALPPPPDAAADAK